MKQHTQFNKNIEEIDMKKFFKWFIGIIIVAAAAVAGYGYFCTDWFVNDEPVVTEEVVTEEVAEPVVDSTEVVVPVDTLSVESVEEITTIPVEKNE